MWPGPQERLPLRWSHSFPVSGRPGDGSGGQGGLNGRFCALRGFTLIEILVTLGLILALSLFVYTSFYATSSRTILTGAAEQIAGDVRLARDLAVSERARYRLSFSPGSAIYSLEKLDPVSGLWGSATGTDLPGPLPAGTRVQSVADINGGYLIYSSMGAPFEGTGTGTTLVGSGTGGVDHIVVVSDGSGRTLDVTVAPGSGRVDIVP